MVEHIGKVDGVDVFYDETQEDNKFLFARRGRELNAVIGNTKDIKIYEIAINHYNKNKD